MTTRVHVQFSFGKTDTQLDSKAFSQGRPCLLSGFLKGKTTMCFERKAL